MKKLGLLFVLLCLVPQNTLYCMVGTSQQIQLRLNKDKIDVPYAFLTAQLGFLFKDTSGNLITDVDPTTKEKYIDLPSELLSSEEFTKLKQIIPIILPNQALSVAALKNLGVFNALINQTNWQDFYQLADKIDFALLKDYMSYYIAHLHNNNQITRDDILKLTYDWHGPIAKYYFLLTTKTLEGVKADTYGVSIQELIDWGFNFSQHYTAGNQSLNLSNLHINNLDGFEAIPGINIRNLNYLNLNNNQLTELPANFLATNTALQDLDLSSNQLTQLPANFLANNTALQFLALSNIQLTQLPANFLATNTALDYLDLSSNKLTALPANFLATSTALNYLNLNNNRLTQSSITALPERAKKIYLESAWPEDID